MSESKRLLIVEDEALVALDIAARLESLGHVVIGQTDRGDTAIELSKREKPDLVLMDVVINGPMDGLTAAKVLSDEGIPVVFLTAHADEATLQRAKITNPYGYILKPFELDDLRSTLELAFYRLRTAPLSPAASQQVSDEQEEELHAEGSCSDEAGAKGDFLVGVPIFSKLPAHAIRKLAAASYIKPFDAGTFVYHESDTLEALYVITTGRVAITKSSGAGKELIVELLGPGDVIGLGAIAQQSDQHTAARAQIDSKLLVIPNNLVSAAALQYPQLMQSGFSELQKRLQKANTLASSLAHARVEARICSTLLTLLPDFGKQTSGTKLQRLFLTRKELAELTGTTPETAIRVTKNLERSGMLDLTRPGIIKILDISGLQQLCEQT